MTVSITMEGLVIGADIEGAELSPIRRKILTGLFAAAGVAGIPTFAAFTVVNVLGANLLGGQTWSGLPATFILLGSAGSAAASSSYMARSGRRQGLAAGYGIGAIGATLAIASAATRSFGLLIVAMVLFGFGGTAIQLSRYAAADVTPIESRAKAISLITWASVVGAVVGPNLVGISGRAAESLRLPPLSGPFLISAAGLLVSAMLITLRLRPDPLEVSRRMAADAGAGAGIPTPEARGLRVILATPRVQIAIAAMAIGQLVMVLVMSMTAVHMRSHDHSWGTVGFVISAHLLGMFALSPVSGWASDRFGRVPVIVAGAFTLIAATLLSASQPNSSAFLTAALFLLGFGWNLGNVAGSALLTDALYPEERARMQGLAEMLATGTSALGGVVSGVILGTLGFANLSLVATLAMVLTLVLIMGRLRALQPQPEAAS